MPGGTEARGAGGEPEPWRKSSLAEAMPIGEAAAAVVLGAGVGCDFAAATPGESGTRVCARVRTSVRAGGRNN